MKLSNAARVTLILIALTIPACSSSGGGAPAEPQADTIAATDDTLNKTEQDLVAAGQREQDAVESQAPQE